MRNKNYLSQLLPYIVAIVSFIAIAGFYFAPQFEGKSLQMHDITQYEGMSHDIEQHKKDTGEDPKWTGNLFGGMPAYLISARYESVILKHTMKVLEFMGAPASLIFIAMFGFFVMLSLWGLNPWVGIVPSLAYGLSTYFFIIIGAGHYTKMVAAAYIPLLMGAVFFTYRKNMWIGAALAAFFGSLEIAASHPQITYYFVMVLAAYWVNECVCAVKAKTVPRLVKATLLLVLAAALAVGSNLAPLWYINQHSKDTIRGGTELTQEGTDVLPSKTQGSGLDIDYATGWSYGRTESFNMFIPNLMGGSSEGSFSSDGDVAQSLGKYNARAMATQLPSYWGEQPMTSGPTYIGAVIMFLCVLGLFLLSGRNKWWIISIMGVALLLAWGKNLMWFTELFFNILPGYNKFRTVAMILIIVEWCVPFVAALTLAKLWSGNYSREQLMRALKNAVYITAGVALMFALFASALFGFDAVSDAQMPADVVEAMKSERLSMLRGDAMRSLMFVLMGAAVVWLYGVHKIKRGALIALLALLVCADLIPVNIRFLPQSKFVATHNTQIKPTEADLLILEDTTLGYRVANLSLSIFNDATTSYFHRSVGGYHGAKLQRYQDVIDRHLSQMNWEVYNMLNTKYIIGSDKESNRLHVQTNHDANGTAWFVEKLDFVSSPNQEIDALSSINTKTEAVVDKRFESMVKDVNAGTDSTATIEMTDYAPNHLTYKYRAAHEGVVVFSEIYYDKGWTAYIDGAEAPYFRADYILRAMVVPSGEHTVEFKFRAPDYDILSNITLISSLLIIAGIVAAVAAIIFGKRPKKDGSEQQQEA